MRIAAVGDLHAGRPNTREQISHLHEVGRDADVLLLAGDLTDYGEPDQAAVLAEELSRVTGQLGPRGYQARGEGDLLLVQAEGAVR